MSRNDSFCEDYREFDEVLGDMAKEIESLAFQTPKNELFDAYSLRLFAVARELVAISGGLQLAVFSEPK